MNGTDRGAGLARSLRLVAVTVVAAAAGIALGGFARGGAAHAARGIVVKGSDTMVILCQRWAEAYMKAHKGQIVQVTGGGSGTGIAALINGTTDICMSSRPMKGDEKRKLRDRFQTMGVEIPVAKDGLSVYVHATNPVKEITFDQLRRIYLGEVTSWKDLGGPDAPITLYGRENNSGTYVYFKDNVLKGRDFSARTQTLPGTAAVVNAVAKDKNGIGYGGAAYAKGVRDLGLSTGAGKPAVLPTATNVANGSYPLTRSLFFYTRVKPAGDQKLFVDWVLSADGQKLATEVGYFPLR
jgi:phosphate transport system substrate-binding protein